MAKGKTKSYLSPGKLLSKQEYEEYKKQQQEVRRKELLQKIAAGRKNLRAFKKQQAYAKSKTGRIASRTTKLFQMARPGGVTAALYQGQVPITSQNVQQATPSMPKRTLKGTSGGKVGRPKGTYDQRYAAYGGVYGFRKVLAQKLRERRLEIERAKTVTPQQQMIINRYQSQQAYQQMNPENKIIPDTYGQTPMGGFMREIDSAANILE